MTLPISTRQSVQKLRDRDFDEPQANAIVEVAEEVARDADEAIAEVAEAADTALKEATGDLVTKEYMSAEMRAFESRVDVRLTEIRSELREFRIETGAMEARMRGEMYRGQNRLMALTFVMATTIALIAIGIVEFM